MRREKEALVGLDIADYSIDWGKLLAKGMTKERIAVGIIIIWARGSGHVV
jgi:hypothetical protein